MASYTTNYSGMEKTNAARNGITKCKWKPRKVSAKRNFPKAFDEVTMDAKLSVSINEPQNLSDNGYGASQLAKKRKVSVVNDLPTGIVGDYKDNVGPVEFEEASTEAGMFDLSYESTDVVKDDYLKVDSVPFEMDSVSRGSSSDDYLKDDLIPSEMDCMSGGNSIYREMLSSDYDMKPNTTIEHEDTDVDDLVNTDKTTHYIKRRRVSAVRCFPPGCGTNTRLENDFTEWKATSDDDEEEIYEEQQTSNVKVVLPECTPSGCGTNTGPLSEEKFENDFTEWKDASDDDEDIKAEEQTRNVKKGLAEADALAPYTELKIHGGSVKAIRFYQSQGQMEIKLSVSNSQNYSIDVKASGEGRGINEHAAKRTTTTRKQLPAKRRVSAVRCYPPECGPDATYLPEEELKGTLTESERHMLICKWCNSL